MSNEYKKYEGYNDNLEKNDDVQDDLNDSQNNYSSELDQSPKINSLNRGQKIGAMLLAFFAFLVIVLWTVQFKNSINEPFNRSTENSNSNQTETCPDGNCQNEASEEVLKNKDTDGDGLSDWDELNIHNTSPYLEDSDSDGFLDKDEIDSDNDPNCPTGRDCYDSTDTQIDTDNSLENSEAFDIFSQVQGEATDINEADYLDYLETNKEMQNASDDQVDASTIRQLLISAGVDESLINTISDEEIMAIYLESLSQQ